MDTATPDVKSEKMSYWNQYYGSGSLNGIGYPSQFAAFMAQEFADVSLVVEIGCGNGRDSIFFARQGFRAIALDGSQSAIESCQSLAKALGLQNLDFIACDVSANEFSDRLRDIAAKEQGRIGVYARFFLHAITEDEEAAFIGALARHLRSGDIVALEYRTPRDAALEKVTGTHYRRYVSPTELHIAAAENGFTVTYAVEGFGFAKYKRDDAYVARCVLEKA